MSEGTVLTPITDRTPFSLHPEDWVTQQDSHDEQGAYFKSGLRLLLPDCFVARDLAVYWVPGQMQDPYVGPDIFISRHQPKVDDPKVWLTYEDGPLALVIEVVSEGTRHKEKGKRDEIYARELRVPEVCLLRPVPDGTAAGAVGRGTGRAGGAGRAGDPLEPGVWHWLRLAGGGCSSCGW